ncbi:flagellar protein FlaG [Phenylobacterium sp.]|uniref:flagellar protein FlaG n=1 Tax=Phenylobacterium sp. TaxID=1871053 RepID=UPI002736BD67|nr:flagellar protein FlaG [Phenylobacterium sp.]
MSKILSTQEAGLLPPIRNVAPEPPAPAKIIPGETASQTDLRLVIEEDQANGSYVYKTVDRLTGEVVAQIPRENVLRLKREAEYEAGAMIRAKA